MIYTWREREVILETRRKLKVETLARWKPLMIYTWREREVILETRRKLKVETLARWKAVSLGTKPNVFTNSSTQVCRIF